MRRLNSLFGAGLLMAVLGLLALLGFASELRIDPAVLFARFMEYVWMLPWWLIIPIVFIPKPLLIAVVVSIIFLFRRIGRAYLLKRKKSAD